MTKCRNSHPIPFHFQQLICKNARPGAPHKSSRGFPCADCKIPSSPIPLKISQSAPNFATVLHALDPAEPRRRCEKPKDPAAAVAWHRIPYWHSIDFIYSRQESALDRGRSASPFKTSRGGKWISHRSSSSSSSESDWSRRRRRARCSLERNEKLPLVCGYEIPPYVCSMCASADQQCLPDASHPSS